MSLQIRLEGTLPLASNPEASDVACSGFQVVFDGGAPSIRFVPGGRRLSHFLTAAVLRGLSDAPALFEEALRVNGPPRPYDVVEVTLAPGELTHGEASRGGSGCIRLRLGEKASGEGAAAVARHEALHLLLASCLRGGDRWTDPELAFADWIVRGIESCREPGVPRFQPPWPRLLEAPARSRLEVQQQLAAVSGSPGVARKYFGEPLFAELQRLESQSDREVIEQRQLWLVESALGAHYLETAARVGDGEELIPIVLDDWLADYEEYSRAVGSPPSGAGNLWRLSDPGWSRDPLVRLSVAAQALQADDHCWFEALAPAGDPLIWKNRGRIRLPLRTGERRSRPAPIHGFRAVLRGTDAPRATAAVEQAARGGAHLFEARALWPRILSRLLTAEPPEAPAHVAAALVQIVDAGDRAAAQSAFEEWSAAAASLRALLGRNAAHVPRVAEPQDAPMLAHLPPLPAAMQLVYGAPPAAGDLLAARTLAARRPVRGALFREHLDAGKPYERVPDLDAPLDPRYRDGTWRSASRAPASLDELIAFVDDDTKDGRLTTPVSHLLATLAFGLEECHYPRPR